MLIKSIIIKKEDLPKADPLWRDRFERKAKIFKNKNLYTRKIKHRKKSY